MFEKILGKYKKNKPKVAVIDNFTINYLWNRSALLINVENGKKRLRKETLFVKGETAEILMLDNYPLITLHGNNRACNTCHKFIAPGYGLDRIASVELYTIGQKLNNLPESLAAAVADITPVLELMPSGLYLIAEMNLYPTDGNGNFFWAFNRETYGDNKYKYYTKKENINSLNPSYLVPLKSPIAYDAAKVEHYKENPNLPALAYFLNGSLCALLDGHNKAAAAALQKRELKAIVIIPPVYFEIEDGRDSYFANRVKFANHSFPSGELLSTASMQLLSGKVMGTTQKKLEKIIGLADECFDIFEWDDELIETGKYFLEASQVISLKIADDISAKNINEIIERKKTCEKEEMMRKLEALFLNDQSLFKKLTFYALSEKKYSPLGEQIFQILATVKELDITTSLTDFTGSMNEKCWKMLEISYKYLQS